MPSDETIVCDPVEFIPERTQVGLDELGLRVVEAEWGDSEHELFLIRQERGEIPGDRHPPNRTVNLKLQARSSGKRTNLIPNPNFEKNTFEWTGGLGGFRTNVGATITRDVAQHWDGTASVRVETPGAINAEGIDHKNIIPVVAGKMYRISVYVKGNTGTEKLYINVGDGVVGNIVRNFTPSKDWQRFDVDFTPKASGNTGVAVATLGKSICTFWVDAVLWEESAELGSYFPTVFQMEKGLVHWKGATNESVSTVGNTLAEALQRLQMKVGRWQDEGGFVKRIPDSRGGFSTPVAFVVYTATLGGLHGWLMAHRQAANEITLTLTVGPYCYGVKELESGEFKGSEVRQLEWEMAQVQGTAPGLFRLRIKNEGAANWLTAISAMESRDHSAAATAQLSYEAEELTMLGAAFKNTNTGASGGAKENLVSSGELANSWQAMLLSKIAATGEHLTHIGPRRIIVRVLGTPDMRVRLEWRVQGATKWIPNEEKKVFVTGQTVFGLVDLGEVRPEKAVLGNQRWEFRISARTEAFPVPFGEYLSLDQIHIFPTEHFAMIEEELESLAGGSIVWEDAFAQAEGVLTGQKAPIGGTYTVGALAGTDFNITANSVQRKAKGTGRIVYAAGSSTSNVLFEGKMVIPATEAVRLASLQQGFILRYVNSTNYLKVGITRGKSGVVGHPQKEDCRIKIIKVVAGVETSLMSGSGNYDWFNSEWSIQVNTEGVITVEIVGENGHVSNFSVTDEVLATGKALAAGACGFYDILEASATEEPARIWDEVKVAGNIKGEEEIKQAACYAGRLMEFRSDGVYRQHATAEVWTKLAPEGILPFAPPSGLEARALKGIMLPSIGNFNAIAENAKYKLSAKVFYFPGYHFASEAS